MNPYFAEFLGTLVLILMGDGVCACTSLEKSKGKGAGWVVITLAWGFAVMCGVFIAGPYSGAHLNPAVTIGLAVAGSFPVTMLIMAIGMSLGGATGYAINPARDLAPRIAHAVLPFKSPKRDSGWNYSWVPVLGPIAGAAFAALCFILIF